MTAPPISEATFMVEEARSAIVDPALPDPEAGVLAGVAELICAAEARADNPAQTTTAAKAVENDLISRTQNRRPRQAETED